MMTRKEIINNLIAEWEAIRAKKIRDSVPLLQNLTDEIDRNDGLRSGRIEPRAYSELYSKTKAALDTMEPESKVFRSELNAYGKNFSSHIDPIIDILKRFNDFLDEIKYDDADSKDSGGTQLKVDGVGHTFIVDSDHATVLKDVNFGDTTITTQQTTKSSVFWKIIGWIIRFWWQILIATISGGGITVVFVCSKTTNSVN